MQRDDEVLVGHMLDISRKDVVWKTAVEEIPRLLAALEPLVRS